MHIDVQAGDLSRFLPLGQWRIKMNAEKANTEQAINDCFAFLNAGFQWQQDKTIVEELVGLRCNYIGNMGLLKIISKNELSLRSIEDIQRRLTEIYKTQPLEWDLNCNKILFQDTVQHVFTKGGFGGGHLIPKYLPPLMQSSSNIISMSKLRTEPTIKERVMYLAMSMLHTRRNNTIAKYNEILEQMQEIQKLTPYELKQSGYTKDIEQPRIFNYKIYFSSFTKQSKYFLLGIFTPAMDSLSKSKYKIRTEYEAIITILALKRYKIEKGRYPDNLDELLSEGYITKLPMDPFSNKPLIYIKEDADFKLYSVGENFTDNQGQLAYYGKGHLDYWGNSNSETGGDAVFWPVQ